MHNHHKKMGKVKCKKLSFFTSYKLMMQVSEMMGRVDLPASHLGMGEGRGEGREEGEREERESGGGSSQN